MRFPQRQILKPSLGLKGDGGLAPMSVNIPANESKQIFRLWLLWNNEAGSTMKRYLQGNNCPPC